ncbi:MAG TPA: NADH-quinone oxidoreductase subunit D, partial [Dehalococcoidia bacterium]|nr:NADH-quinone oxidoreductase subunit D [Dehalococcoidia bacterium]
SEQGIADCNHLLTDNEIFIERTRGIGICSAEDAIDFGLSGPILRGSGVAYDVRKALPYSVYDRFDFTIPTGTQGDVYDRYAVRMEEMRQSVGIVRQALDQLPDGPILAKLPRSIRPPAGDAFVGVENPRGDFAVYLVSHGGNTPYRVKLRGPSFCNLMGLRHMLRGAYVADAVVILGSLDIVLGEVDR